MNVIEINSDNYKDYQHLDIIAFSFAEEGAQGEGGGWTLDGDFRWQAISHQFCLYHQLGTSHIALPYPPGMRLRFIPYHAT